MSYLSHKYLLKVFLLFTLCTQSVFSADYKVMKAGMSSERLERVVEEFRRDVDNKKIPGFVSMIMRKGQLVQFTAYGYADIEKRIPLKEDSIFRIYSMTKPITGVALMILVEEGKIRLDDPVKKYIPSFGKTKVFTELKDLQIVTQPLNRDITIRDLATHTSGLSYL